MAPKTEETTPSQEVKVLIDLIRTAKTFEPDLKAAAPVLGIKDAKNVYVIHPPSTPTTPDSVSSPRKINSVLAPHGMKLANGRIVPVDEEAKGSGEVAQAAPKTPTKSPAKASTSTKAKGGKSTAMKKRKLEVIQEVEEEDESIKVEETGNDSADESSLESEDKE